ncbi:unnamed protein product [Bursaphelenchus okinawaensis]|uniref:Mediator of RNA polymerase II transcription subunit 20 n=1 Tax=Bursaphelenchus okinawaensis TaxID=465554 RepID=A0A811KVE5_9BILA|nr:unnamed protein product [Bursaphelenchus okinawaensis]CAG9112880.1 unnamed protein product [Bursaphelenchus okinawaensis]
MGVAWVIKSNESAKTVEAALERAGAVKTGGYKVDCTTYRPTMDVAGQIKNFYVLHHSNFPESSHIFCDLNADGTVSPRATSDLGFDLILQKFSNALLSDNALSFELTGTEYKLHDFRIRYGVALMGRTSAKGIVVEFEFAASQITIQCFGLLQEIVQGFFPEQKTIPLPLHRQRNHTEYYYSSDTLEQYLRIFQEMRTM